MSEGLIYYKDAEKEILEKHQDELNQLKKHKPLFKIAMEYGLMYSKNHQGIWSEEKSSDSSFALGTGTINCLSLNLSLDKDGSIIRDIGPIIEELKEHPRLKFIKEHDFIEAGWKGWKFQHKETEGNLLVRVWFENSRKCKKVGTGEYEEIMEVVCED